MKNKKLFILVAVFAALCIAAVAIAVSASDYSEGAAEENASAKNTLEENDTSGLKEPVLDFDANYVSKHQGAHTRKYSWDADNEFINEIAAKKCLSDDDVLYLLSTPKEILGLSYEEAINKRDVLLSAGCGLEADKYNCYAQAIATGEALAKQLRAQEQDRITYGPAMQRDLKIGKNCDENCGHSGCIAARRKLVMYEFEAKAVENHIDPLMEKGEFELAAREMQTLMRFVRAEGKYISDSILDAYDAPDYQAVLDALAGGSTLSEIFYLDVLE